MAESKKKVNRFDEPWGEAKAMRVRDKDGKPIAPASKKQPAPKKGKK